MAFLLATLSGQATALGSQTQKGAHGTSTTTTTSTLPKVPAAAEPLLKRLIGVAGTITIEEQQSTLLSEQYDQARLHLASADVQILQLDHQMAEANQALKTARLQLRDAAIEAYVTGQSSVVDDSLLSSDLSTSSMVDVYASVATGHVSGAIRVYARSLSKARELTPEQGPPLTRSPSTWLRSSRSATEQTCCSSPPASSSTRSRQSCSLS